MSHDSVIYVDSFDDSMTLYCLLLTENRNLVVQPVNSEFIK